MDPIRVLVVDDSPFMRKALERMLQAPDIEVVGSARDGLDALEKIPQLNPDIVTLDVEMPRLDGLGCLKRIMAEMPRAVLMVSSLTQEGAQATLEALALGALDFIPKETSLASASILQIQQDLQEKVRKLARSPRFRKSPAAAGAAAGPAGPARCRPPPAPAPAAPGRGPAGRPGRAPGPNCWPSAAPPAGPRPSRTCCRPCPRRCRCPASIVQHMPGTFTKAFAERLNGLCQVEVREADARRDARLPGCVYIAPGGLHMLYRQRGPPAPSS